MVYAAKKDWWARIILLPALSMIFAGLGMPILLFNLLPAPMFLVFFLEAALGVMMLWAFFHGAYEITESHLLVRFGPLRWRIPLDHLVEVVPKRGLGADVGFGLAWSADRLIVRYRKASGKKAWFALAIAPEDKVGFLLELTEKAPQLEVLPDGSLRSSETANPLPVDRGTS